MNESQVDNGAGIFTEANSEQALNQMETEQTVSDAIEEKMSVESGETVDPSEASESEELSTEPEAEQESEKDLFASKFAALSRREKALRQREKEMESRLADLESKLQASEAPKEEPKVEEVPLEYRLRSNPLQTLEELGLNYQTLTELALNDGKLSPDMKLDLLRQDLEKKHQSEIEELRNQILEDKRAREEEKYEQTINNFKAQISEVVSTSPEFELIQANDAVDVVYDVIEQHYKDTGRILDTKEAAEQVENFLMEEAQKLLKLNKLAQRKAEEVKPPVTKKATPTLTNSQAAQVPHREEKLLSNEESLARAAQMIKWQD